MNAKPLRVLTLILFSASFAWAKTGFSLLWEHSFLTGKAVLDGEEHEDYDFDPNVKGGRVLFVLRYNINEYLSLGLGSGVSVSKLNVSYEFGSYNDFSTAMFYIPIFGEVRGQFPIYEDLLRMFVSLRMGGSLSPLTMDAIFTDYSFDGGFFFEPMFGISIGNRSVLFDVGMGYSYQKSQLVESYNYYECFSGCAPIEIIERYPFSLRQLSLNLGVNFLFGKK